MSDPYRSPPPARNNDMSTQRVIVVVFAMPDCPACEEYVPKFQQYARPYIEQGGLQVFIYDVSSADENLQAFADRFKINATPTTLVLPRGPGFIKAEGDLDGASIENLLRKAYGVHLGVATIRPF